MQSFRVVKSKLRNPSKSSRDRIERRLDLALRISVLGIEHLAMGRCTPCQNSNSVCFMLDGYSKCSTCTKKSLSYCDGMFSISEFDALTAKRNRLVEAARRKGEKLRSLLKEVAQATSEQEQLQKEADDLLAKQKQLLLQEAQALDALDHADPPPQASSTILVGLDDAQLEQMFELDPGSMSGYEGPIPIDRSFRYVFVSSVILLVLMSLL